MEKIRTVLNQMRGVQFKFFFQVHLTAPFFLSFLLSVFRAALQVEKELVRFLTVSRCKEILENKIMTTESDLRTLRGKPVNRMT